MGFEVEPFVRYHILKIKDFSLLLQGSGILNSSLSTKSIVDKASGDLTVGLNANIGLAFNVNDHLIIEGLFGGLRYSKTLLVRDASERKTKEYVFDFNDGCVLGIIYKF